MRNASAIRSGRLTSAWNFVTPLKIAIWSISWKPSSPFELLVAAGVMISNGECAW